MPDDVDQVAEAGDGGVGQHVALEHRPDPFHLVETRGVGGQLEHPQPGLGARGGSRLGARGWWGAAIGGSGIELAVPAGLACWFSVMVPDTQRLALRAGPGLAEGRMRRRQVMVAVRGASAHRAGCRGKD